MSLTRKALVAMGIEPEKIDQIIEMHTETVDAVKAERDAAKDEANKYKADSDKLAGVEKELSDLRAEATNPDSLKEKYDQLKNEYDTYKSEVAAKETKAAKTKAYREMLRSIGISEKRIDSVVRVADLDSVELDKDGTIKGVEELKAKTKNEWADFIVSEGIQGAKTPTPPTSSGKISGGSATKEEIMKIKDSNERQKAIVANHELFGF